MPATRKLAFQPIEEETQQRKRDITETRVQQMENVLNPILEKESNEIKDQNKEEPKESVEMEVFVKADQTAKDPVPKAVVKAHTKELKQAVKIRLPKEDKGMIARSVEKLGQLRKSIDAFSNYYYGNGGPAPGEQNNEPVFYAPDKQKGAHVSLIFRCNSISRTLFPGVKKAILSDFHLVLPSILLEGDMVCGMGTA